MHVCSIAPSCPTLCDPMDCSPPGSSVHGIIQARILEYVCISSSRASSWHRDKTRVSCIGRWILYSWATWEAPKSLKVPSKDNVAVNQSLVRWKGEKHKWGDVCKLRVSIKALLSFKFFIKKHIKLRLTKRCAKWINFRVLVRDHVKETMTVFEV